MGPRVAAWLRQAGGVHRAVLAAMLVGCSFHPGSGNGADGSGGDGGGGSGQIDAPVASGDGTPIGTGDAATCFGTGIVHVCLDAAPTAPVTLTAADSPIDTAHCARAVHQTSGADLCVIAGTDLTLSGVVTAIGPLPLVLIGAHDVVIAGTLDASSTTTPHVIGAGANDGACVTTGLTGGNDRGGGGGGAGGSFGTTGGNGGVGDTNDNFPPTGTAPAGRANPAQPTPTVLRGGCGGGKGGEGDVGNGDNPGGAGGDGGGAIFLIAGHQLTISGAVFASGAGGGVIAGGNSPGVGGFEQGGGGGGAGGMIGLDAPTVVEQGTIAANGGGGAGGGGNVGGTAGENGTTGKWNQRAKGGIGDATGGAGNGALGTALGGTTALDGASAQSGGGGGAGGLGLIWVYGALQGGTMISPAPIPH